VDTKLRIFSLATTDVVRGVVVGLAAERVSLSLASSSVGLLHGTSLIITAFFQYDAARNAAKAEPDDDPENYGGYAHRWLERLKHFIFFQRIR
jgi:hypothetical protein